MHLHSAIILSVWTVHAVLGVGMQTSNYLEVTRAYIHIL